MGASKDEDAEALKARLDALSERIAQTDRPAPTKPAETSELGDSVGRAWGLGTQVVGELVGAVGVGAAIGWALDEAFGTKPALLLVFLGLGTAAAFLNLFRLGKARQAPPQDE